MLVDNGSSINILFGATYDRMIDHELTTMTSLYMVLLEIAFPREKNHSCCGNMIVPLDSTSFHGVSNYE